MYAKDYFKSKKINSDPGLCFVLMPFAKKFDWAWKIIDETVENPPFNLKCERADDFSKPGYIMDDVLKKIGEASLVIVDVSDKNPNVYYELGIAHSFKDNNQVILISQSIEAVPFDLRSFRHFIYSKKTGSLKRTLTKVLSESGVKQYDLKLKQFDTKKFSTRLTGTDKCSYEVELFVEYIADDGVTFRMDIIRYKGGNDPEKIKGEWSHLNSKNPSMKVPNLDWSVWYKIINSKEVRFILGKARGWKPTLQTN
jgi:hypothetical protein